MHPFPQPVFQDLNIFIDRFDTGKPAIIEANLKGLFTDIFLNLINQRGNLQKSEFKFGLIG